MIISDPTRLLVDGKPCWVWPDGTVLPVIRGGDGPDEKEEEEQDPPPDPKDDDEDDDLSDEDDVEKLRTEAKKWKSFARKHERSAKTISKELEKVQRERMSDQEKAVEDARTEGELAGSRKAAESLVPAAFALAAGDRIDEKRLEAVVDGIDPTKFLNDDGQIDVERVKAFVDGIAPATGDEKKKWPDTGQGRREPGAKDPLEEGRARAARKYRKNDE